MGRRNLVRDVGEALARDDSAGGLSPSWLARRFGGRAADVGSVLDFEERLAGAAALAAALPGLTLVRALGEGAMGRVYLAEPAGGGRRVAVKVLRPELAASGRARDRFRREAQAARRVRHANVVAVLDARMVATPAGHVPVIVMPYVPGPTLRARIDARGALDERACRRVGAALARGLAAVHAAGIVHRDVKPANVLLARGGAKLLDLGCARLLDAPSALTSAGRFVGTFAYAAPEQFDASLGPVDGRADLYALGVTLFEAAAGVAPEGRPMRRRVADAAPGVSREFDDLVAALTRQRVAERPASAADVARILEETPRAKPRAVGAAAPALDAALESARRGAGGAVLLASDRGDRARRVVLECAERAERATRPRVLHVRWDAEGRPRVEEGGAAWRTTLAALAGGAAGGPAVVVLENCDRADPMDRAAVAALAAACGRRPLVMLGTLAPARGRRLFGELIALPHVRWVDLDAGRPRPARR